MNITANQIVRLSEEYLTLGKFLDATFPIYKNPTSTDLLDLHKIAKDEHRKLDEIRFVADSHSHNVYIADAQIGLHKIISKYVNSQWENNWEKRPWILDGLASVNGSNMTMTYWDKYEVMTFSSKMKNVLYKNFFMDSVNLDWSWVDKYIHNCGTRMKEYRVKVENFYK